MKNIKKLIGLPVVLLLITSCNGNSDNTTTTSTPSTSSPTSTPIPSTSVNVSPDYELEYETNILPFSSEDTINKDHSNSMALHNIVSKALVNSNHSNTTWRQIVSGTIEGFPYNSLQETTFLENNISYQEASLLYTSNYYGRKINAFTSPTDFVFGHSKERISNYSLVSGSNSALSLDVNKDDLEHVSKEYLLSNIGDFSRIENLFPINRYTVEESLSKVENSSNTYTITLFPKSYTFFNNYIEKYQVEMEQVNLNAVFTSLPKEDVFIKYEITNDYQLKSIEYNLKESEKTNISSTVSFIESTSINNISTYLEVIEQDIATHSIKVMENLKTSLSSLLRSIIYQLANSSQFKFPYHITLNVDDNKRLDINGNIEFQTSWSLSDFKGLDINDEDQILRLILKSLSFNIDTDIKLDDKTANFVTSYNCKTKLGQYTITKFDDTKEIVDYDFSNITSFLDIYNYFVELASKVAPDIEEETDKIDWKKIYDDFLDKLEEEKEADIKYIDLYFYDDLLKEEQYKEEVSGTKIISVSLDGKSFDHKDLYLDYLNTNDPNLLFNNVFSSFSALYPDKKAHEDITFDYSSLTYEFFISQNIETSLLKDLFLNIQIKDDNHTYSFTIDIDELKEMNSPSEFVLNKYVTQTETL